MYVPGKQLYRPGQLIIGCEQSTPLMEAEALQIGLAVATTGLLKAAKKDCKEGGRSEIALKLTFKADNEVSAVMLLGRDCILTPVIDKI